MDPLSSLAGLQTCGPSLEWSSSRAIFFRIQATATANLWAVTKATSAFVWGPEHQSVFDQIRWATTAPTGLQQFDSTRPVTIQVDASLRGLGAVLLQASDPVEFASKLLRVVTLSRGRCWLSSLVWKNSICTVMANTHSLTVIVHLKSVFEEHGMPNKLITINNSQHTSPGL